MRPCWAYWASKKCTKNKPGLNAPLLLCPPGRQSVISGFLEMMKDIKEVELHLTMGESIVHAVLGPLSPVGRDTWTTDKKSYVPKVWALTQLFSVCSFAKNH